MGKINYSISARVVNIAERTVAAKNGTLDSFVPEVKYYATAQQQEYLSLDDFAQHISEHHSKYGKGDIYCIITEAVSCLREKLLEGCKISMGDLGEFSVTISSKGADYYNEFTAQKISSVNVRWIPGSKFKNLIDDANFELVESRKAAAATMKAMREGYPTRPASEEDASAQQGGSSSSEGSGSSTSGSGTSGSGTQGGENTGGTTEDGGDSGMGD